jgi:hypothetical protein
VAHRAASQQAVTSPDSIGRSSTLRPFDSITSVSGMLGRPIIGERKRRRPSDGYAGQRQPRVLRVCILQTQLHHAAARSLSRLRGRAGVGAFATRSDSRKRRSSTPGLLDSIAGASEHRVARLRGRRRPRTLRTAQIHKKPSLRANGSRECAPDDRLREAIHGATRKKEWIASSQVLLAMTAGQAFAISPRVSREVCCSTSALCNQRARGMPDARCTRSLACAME